MKRIIIAVLAVLLTVAFASCETRPDESAKGSVNQSVQSDSEEYDEYPDNASDSFIKSGSNGMFEYSIYGRHAEITKYIGSEKSVKIPKGIERKKVTVIGEEAFQDKESVTEVIIPDTVEKIGKKAFYRCFYLDTVSGGDSVTHIDELAFAYDGRLKSFNFGAKLISVANKAFMWCNSIDRISYRPPATPWETEPSFAAPARKSSFLRTESSGPWAKKRLCVCIRSNRYAIRI